MSISSAASQATVSFVAPWQMPILAENYPYRDPFVTDEEATLMETYATTPANTMTGVSVRKVLGQLQRFDKPFLDTLRLRAESERPIAKSRRHLFKYMTQTRRVFWSWSKETWIEVIQTAPGGGQQNAGPRFWMIALAISFLTSSMWVHSRHISSWQIASSERILWMLKLTSSTRRSSR